MRLIDENLAGEFSQLNRVEEIYLNERFSWNKEEIELIIWDISYILTAQIDSMNLENLRFGFKQLDLNSAQDTSWITKRLFFLSKEIGQKSIEEVYEVIDSINYEEYYNELIFENYSKNDNLEKLVRIIKERGNEKYEFKDVLAKMEYPNSYYNNIGKEPFIHGCLTEAVKASNQHVYNYNPAVMNATIQTMRYAAFFRYVKENFPDQWTAFLQQIEPAKEEIYHYIKTPIEFVER